MGDWQKHEMMNRYINIMKPIILREMRMYTSPNPIACCNMIEFSIKYQGVDMHEVQMVEYDLEYKNKKEYNKIINSMRENFANTVCHELWTTYSANL